MRIIFLTPAAGILLAASSMAFAAPTAATGSHNPAVKNSAVHSATMPAHGANSFTEAQARGRIAKAGYTQVSKLAKDRHGAWTGSAMKGAKTVNVALDYKGNVTVR
ncbi:MAG: hypothetical protein H0X36_11150 [Sphingomonadaceae bacterium]|nr:hypothetical protein [Sphingomonadaceae bacterium]